MPNEEQTRIDTAAIRNESGKIDDEKLKEIFSRSRQAVKQIINNEASREAITEDILNFKVR